MAHAAGTAWAFGLAVLLIAAWFAYGLLTGFTDTVQLVINTATTIITFLMVFLIQHTQNRDTKALHLKVDELIRVSSEARNSLIGIERKEEED